MKEILVNETVKRKTEGYGVVVNAFRLSIGSKDLISEANFAIYPGRKVALIGRNGSGKTTLLETIYSVWKSRETPEEVIIGGSLHFFPRTKIGFLPQNVQVDFSGSVEEYLNVCSSEVSKTFNRYNELTEVLNVEEPNAEILDEYGEVLNRMTELEAWDFNRKRAMILAGLDLQEEYLKRDMREVSGGEATQVALAGILLSLPNLILLDEPTNNLDPKNLLFLERWIKNLSSSLLLVSHDREFLDDVIEEILEIDEATKQIFLFGGNYSFYAAKKKEMFEAQARQFEEQQRKRRQLEKDADRLRSEASRFEVLSKDAYYRAKGASLARRAKVQLERIERELSRIPAPVPPKKPYITVFETDKNSDLLIAGTNVSFSYSENGQDLLSDISFSVHGDERVGIIGDNGIGKTTLLKILLGELKPNVGTAFQANQVRIGYLPQTLIVDDPKENIIDFVRKRVPIHENDARTILGKVLFADPYAMRVGDFSAGELRRIELVVLFASKPNLVIFDEPTNHLDIYTIEMLEDAMQEYNGAMITVSHDQRFLRNVGVTKMMILDKSGKLIIQTSKSTNFVQEIFQETFVK